MVSRTFGSIFRSEDFTPESPKNQRFVEQGHIFVVHMDLSKVSCDAWMLPTGIFRRRLAFVIITDEELTIEPSWNISDTIKIPPKPPNWRNSGIS